MNNARPPEKPPSAHKNARGVLGHGESDLNATALPSQTGTRKIKAFWWLTRRTPTSYKGGLDPFLRMNPEPKARADRPHQIVTRYFPERLLELLQFARTEGSAPRRRPPYCR